MPVSPELLDRYTTAALLGARSDAAAIAAQVMGRSGAPAALDRHSLDRPSTGATARLVTELLAPAQVDVGERWLDGRCSVGQEHAATSVTESVLAAFTVGFEPEPHRGTFVMACAEGERHALPARMACELLVLDGWNVVDLGPATSAVELRSYLAGIDAEVVGVSATVTTSLPGAARSIDVARRLGFTVIAGGAAFGTDRRRAHALGAHGWAGVGPVDLDLDRVCWDDPTIVDLDGPWSELEDRRRAVVNDAVGWVAVHRDTELLRSASWLEAVVHELEYAVDTVTAALLCDDPAIVHEHRMWLGRLGEPDRGATALGASVYDALVGVLHQHSPPALRLIQPVAS